MSNLEISRAQRLDQKVIELLPSLSRSFAERLVEEGKVTVNNEVVQKPGHKLRTGDTVTVNYDIRELDQIPDIALPVLYEDNDVMVINKSVGILTHSKGAFNPEATVATFLRKHTSGMAGERAGIVHRLDRATSGVIICAKNQQALSFLQKQFAQRKVKKTYIAVVMGHMPHDHAIIDMPIERNPKKPQTFRTGLHGKAAMTEYNVLEAGKQYTLLELKPQTGRTHQLRVHLAELGHPILGDSLYGGAPAERLFLHAAKLELTLPSRERKTFSVVTPRQFRAMIKP